MFSFDVLHREQPPLHMNRPGNIQNNYANIRRLDPFVRGANNDIGEKID